MKDGTCNEDTDLVSEQRLETNAVLPVTRKPTTYTEALAHVAGLLGESIDQGPDCCLRMEDVTTMVGRRITLIIDWAEPSC